MSEPEVFTAWYDRYARELHRYLARRLDVSTADDLVAQTFLVAWEQRERYRPDRAGPRAWLYGIATNLLRRHARGTVRGLRAAARLGARAEHADPPELVAADRVDAGALAKQVAVALAGLRREELDVLLLIAWADFTPAEVADALELNVGTVRTRLYRARRALREHLGTEDSLA